MLQKYEAELRIFGQSQHFRKGESVALRHPAPEGRNSLRSSDIRALREWYVASQRDISASRMWYISPSGEMLRKKSALRIFKSLLNFALDVIWARNPSQWRWLPTPPPPASGRGVREIVAVFSVLNFVVQQKHQYLIDLPHYAKTITTAISFCQGGFLYAYAVKNKTQ